MKRAEVNTAYAAYTADMAFHGTLAEAISDDKEHEGEGCQYAAERNVLWDDFCCRYLGCKL